MGKGSKILVIDKEPEFIEVARKAAELSSWQLITASGKEEGFKKALKEKPDLIILGYLEPRGSSFALHKELRKEPLTQNIPLLVVDVRPEEHSRKGWRKGEGLQMDAEDYISRPVEPAELQEIVKRIMQRTLVKALEPEEVLEHMEEALKRIDKIEETLVK